MFSRTGRALIREIFMHEKLMLDALSSVDAFLFQMNL